MAIKNRIAIFSGAIPSTTFIENLITGIAEKDFQLFILGRIEGKTNYPLNVHLLPTYKSEYLTLLNVIKLSFLLFFSRPVFLLRLYKNVLRKNPIRRVLIKLGFFLPLIRSKIEILHIQWTTHLATFEELKEVTNIKMIVSLRGSHTNYSPFIDPEIAACYVRLFPKCNRFHSVSNAMVPKAVKYGAEAYKIKVIYTSVDKSTEEASLKTGNLHTPLELIAVGRFEWTKGYDYLIDALALLKSQGFDFRFYLVAAGKIPDEIKFQLFQYGLNDQVVIINGLDHDQTLVKIRNSDILLLPSVEEGIANVAVEAMALGTIVISTNCGGMEELIDDGINGFIVPIRNINAMAEKIIMVKELTRIAIDEIRKEAKNKVKSQFSRQRMICEFVKLYNEVD